jgi:hypothetical protein
MLDYLVKLGANKLPLDPYIKTSSYKVQLDTDAYTWQDGNYTKHIQFRAKKIVGQFTMPSLTFDQFNTFMSYYNSAIVSGDDGQEKVNLTVYVPKLGRYRTIVARFDDFTPSMRTFSANVQKYDDITLKFEEY